MGSALVFGIDKCFVYTGYIDQEFLYWDLIYRLV